MSAGAGGLKPVLDAVLTGPSFDGTGNAYGSTPCAGWTRVFTDTNKSVYYPPVSATARAYYRLDDTEAVEKDTPFAGYETMSDVDTGTNQFPGLPFTMTKLMRNNAGWVIAADHRTCLILVKSTSTYWFPAYFGEFVSYVPNDVYGSIALGVRYRSSPVTFFSPLSIGPGAVYGANADVAIVRNWNGEPDQLTAGTCYHAPLAPTSQGAAVAVGSTQGPFPGLNPVDGKLWITPIEIWTNRDQPCLRGRFRGAFIPACTARYYADLDIFNQGGNSYQLFYTFSFNVNTCFALQLNEPEA